MGVMREGDIVRTIDHTHDPSLRSWVDSANTPETDFPIQNLPFGVFRQDASSEAARIGVAIGDQILDLVRCREVGLLDGLSPALLDSLASPSLNALMGLGAPAMGVLRQRLVKVLGADGWGRMPGVLVAMEAARLATPAVVGDFSDFYASIAHATNVGRLFRPGNPLSPNYKYVPIGYHGRSSSIVSSGTLVTRPSGQVRPSGDREPSFRPSGQLDYEAEVGMFVGAANHRGHPVGLDEAEDHLFGLCLLNDWSARDIQVWESQPLGPFLSKSFATTVSPWVVTLEALAPFRCPAYARPPDDPPPLPHLSPGGRDAAGAFDVEIEVYLQTRTMRESGTPPVRVSRGAFRDMYWTPAQLLTHHTSNGCNLRPGDLLGSGTVSGVSSGSLGCLLEITRAGAQPMILPNGEARAFLEDGDEVVFRGYCRREGFRGIGFGECRGAVGF
jgi:fumarylacetoacetase